MVVEYNGSGSGSGSAGGRDPSSGGRENPLKKIEPYKEKPERIPDEKIEIVFHQGERLGRCFGEHSSSFFSGVDPTSHVNCRSSSAGFYSDAVSEAEEKIARRMKKQMDDLLREAFLK